MFCETLFVFYKLRKLISLLLCAALVFLLGVGSASAAFSDVADEKIAYAVSVLQSVGVVDGYDDGIFRPGETLTRSQFCKMAVVAMGLEDQASSYSRKTIFTDVPGGKWYSGYVNLAYAKGIINGYGNGYFGPDDTITFGQAVTLLIRMLGYTSADVGDYWPADYVSFASDIELSDGVALSSGAAVTRGDAALLFLNLLQADTASGSLFT